MPYRPPTAQERKTYFWFIKQASSLKAWSQVFEQYAQLIESIDQIHDPDSGPKSFPTEEYIPALKCQGAMRRALERLQKGDRRCFKWLLAPGHFSEGVRMVDYWWEQYNAGLQGGHSGPFYLSFWYFWDDLYKVILKCRASYQRHACVLQPRYTDVPAFFESAERELGLDGSSGRTSLCWFHQHHPNLPEVPKPSLSRAPVVISTGDQVPEYGIWEPYNCSPEDLHFILSNNQSPGDVLSRYRDGCMNYLHAHDPAPTIGFPEDDLARKGKATTWLLIESDERYLDALIPDEEESYKFVPLDLLLN